MLIVFMFYLSWVLDDNVCDMLVVCLQSTRTLTSPWWYSQHSLHVLARPVSAAQPHADWWVKD